MRSALSSETTQGIEPVPSPQPESDSVATAPFGMAPLFAMTGSIGFAVLAQTVLLRTHTAMPAIPLFALSCAIGGWVAVRAMPGGRVPGFGAFRAPARGSAWKVALAIAVICNAGCLVLFGRNQLLNLAWLLFAASSVAVGTGFWLLDGRPGLRVDWLEERPWLIALGGLVVVGGALRFIWLGGVPYGLWFDEAYSGLQVNRILMDPSFRPVYVGGLAQEPSLLWYLMVPAFKLFGATQLAVRIPAAVGGTLGIFAIYLLGRELFSRKVGLLAAAILTTLAWHITFSRLAFNTEWSVTLDAFALFLAVRGLKTGSWTAAGLGGISLGIGLNMYYTSRVMVAVVGFAIVALWLTQRRSGFSSLWRLAAASAMAGAIVISPLGEFAEQHPVEFNSRLNQASVLQEVNSAHSYQPVIQNLEAHLLMFNLAGDRNARHNLPGQPELNFLLAGLFVLGLGISVARWRHPEYLLLPVWALLMLAGGVLSVSFEAPQSLRTVDEVNVVVLLCALPLALLWQAGEAVLGVRPRPASVFATSTGTPIASTDAPQTPLSAAAAGVPWTSTRGTQTHRRQALERISVVWQRVRARPLLLLIPGWILVSIRMTDPLYRHITSMVLPGPDGLLVVWFDWWARHALFTLHQWPLTSTYMFSPQRVALPFEVTAVMSLPLQPVFGLVGTANALLLIDMVLCCVCGFLFVRQETGSARAAVVGGFIFAYAPYKLAHLTVGHDHFTNWPEALFAMFLLRWLRQRRRRDAVAAGVSLGALGLLNGNQFSFTIALGALLFLGGLWISRPTGRDLAKWFGGGVTVASSALVVMLPLLVPLAGWLLNGDLSGASLSGAQSFAPDLLGLFTPPYLHTIWGKFGSDVAVAFHFRDVPKVVFLGYTALALGLLAAVVRAHRNVYRWWLITAFFCLLSLGPFLRVAGSDRFVIHGFAFTIPLLFTLLHLLPILGGILVPGYAAGLTALGLAVLAGYGTRWLLDRLDYTPGLALSAALCLFVLLESLITPIPLEPPPQPNPVYLKLAQQRDQLAVLEEPLGWRTELGGWGDFDPRQIYWATIAQKPLVAGYISRGSPQLVSYYEQQPALSMFVFPDRAATPQSQDRDAVTRALQDSKVGYIVLHQGPHYAQLNAYLQLLGYQEFYRDSEVATFAVPR